MTGGREVRLDGVVKSYGATEAVAGVDVIIAPGEFCTLLGPSGSGKTTLLKLIAGFERPSAGRVLIGGRDMADVPVAKRDIGMVFQNYALFPNMTVEENVAFPLEARGVARSESGRRINDALGLVEMDGFAARYPRELSGGQQQRVALARALVFDPVILLMDEPLGALDKNLREAIQLELKLLHRRLGVTIVYVTHDQSEALALSHEIAVMSEGRIQQIGSPRAVYERPINAFVADFVGSTNFLDGSVLGPDGTRGHYRVRTEIGDLSVLATETFRADDKVLISVRPEDVELTEARPQAATNVREGIVDQKIFLGEVLDFQVKLGNRILLSRQHPSLRTPIGNPIFIQLDPEKCVALRAA